MRPDTAPWIFVATIVLLAGLVLWPARRRPIIGIALRKGHVLLILLAFFLGTVPLPLAFVINGDSVAWAAAVPTPVPAVLEHHHPDHLGSTHLVTTGTGDCKRYLRYRPFGKVSRFACGTRVWSPI